MENRARRLCLDHRTSKYENHVRGSRRKRRTLPYRESTANVGDLEMESQGHLILRVDGEVDISEVEMGEVNLIIKFTSICCSLHPQVYLILKVMGAMRTMGKVRTMGEVRTIGDVDSIPRNSSLMS
ncbi:hypothetical protein Acr_07g0016190 [Actinidia rufa]|uniref:Uncharacterized protein n=1 Tax=Actinidia rufa TaxID=165716 RepID=A0A7J0EYG1_9ERIC|nr:hypothetical protein Acr_07g0016190 [Actinidia rufa]